MNAEVEYGTPADSVFGCDDAPRSGHGPSSFSSDGPLLEVRGLDWVAGGFRLACSFVVRRSEYVVVLGPTGSGKTALLECICGVRPSAGRICVDGVDMSGSPPRKRGIGYVPQDYALFPHLSVRRNIEFALRLRRLSRQERRDRVNRYGELLGIAQLLDRGVRALSGGEKQRVALARALVTEPRLLLLDEPVSALDEENREAVCCELRKLPERTGVTVVHVCHSLEEARTVGDRILLLRAGRIVQSGAWSELARAPVDRGVVSFLRLPNIFPGQADPAAGRVKLEPSGIELVVSGTIPEGAVLCRVPLGAVEVVTDGARAAENRIEGVVARVADAGPMLHVTLGRPLRLSFYLPLDQVGDLDLRPGSSLRVGVPAEAVTVLPDGMGAKADAAGLSSASPGSSTST